MKRQRNYLAADAPCDLDRNTRRDGFPDPHGYHVIDRRQVGTKAVAAKDVWLDGQWLGVLYYCLNRPDNEGWNWLAVDGTKVEHTTLNNVQAERALVSHMKHPRQRNPRKPTLVDVHMNRYDEEVLHFVFDNRDGTYDVIEYEDNIDKDHWTEQKWTRVVASTPEAAKTVTDYTAVGMPYAATRVRRVLKLPKWADAYRKPQDSRELATEFVAKHADDRSWKQRLPGGTTRPPCDFDRDALAAGLEVELEHTTDPAVALEIAMDHLDEDPKYYKALAKIHREARNPGAPKVGMRETRLSARVRNA